MNYRHIYHAGNFADIIKHVVLVSLIEHLKKKPKNFAVLDAFAGVGLYNIVSEAALKTGESDHGIKKLLAVEKSSKDMPELLQLFLNTVKSYGSDYYPGSPLITASLLRSDDRLIACELHPEDHNSLKELLPNTHNIDAYQAVKAFIPFKENRGLVFLDPPFEVTDEFNKIVASLRIIKHRAPSGCILIWYPIKDPREVKGFYHACQDIGFKESLIIEYELRSPSLKDGMKKCGLLIINPPNIKNEITKATNYLARALALRCTFNSLDNVTEDSFSSYQEPVNY